MGGKPQKHLKEVSADKKGHIIQAVAHYCGTLPTGRNTTTGHVRRIVEVLEERISVGRSMPSGTSLPTWTSGRVLAKNESSGQKNLVTLY